MITEETNDKSTSTGSILDGIASYIKNRQSTIVETLRCLVEAESPSGYEPGSRAVVGILEERAARLSTVTNITRLPVPGYGEHIKIEFGHSIPGGPKPTLLLGHTDTVHPVGSIEARPWRVEGDRIYSPGIFDMKAGCLMALETVGAMEAAGLSAETPFVLMLMCDEETGSENGRAHVETEAVKAARVLVLEPPAPGGIVKTGRKGTGSYTVTAQGIASHAGLDHEKGASAILELARQIDRLHAMTNYSLGTTVNVGVISGGTRSNVVAENAVADVDTRFTTNDEGRRIMDEVLSLTPVDKRVKLSITGEINRPPLERTAKTLALYEQAKIIAAEIGFDLKETQVGGASDGNFAAALGIPVLDGLGINGDGAHAAHEHIVVTDFPNRCALLAGMLSRA